MKIIDLARVMAPELKHRIIAIGQAKNYMR